MDPNELLGEKFKGEKNGDYQLEHFIGQGSFGYVYRAICDRGKVAVKILRPRHMGDKKAVKNFWNDIVLDKIESKHILIPDDEIIGKNLYGIVESL